MNSNRKRTLNSAKLLNIKSFSLFGPRSIDKIILIKQQRAVRINLVTKKVQGGDFKSLRALQNEAVFSRYYLVSHDRRHLCPSLADFIDRLWHGLLW